MYNRIIAGHYVLTQWVGDERHSIAIEIDVLKPGTDPLYYNREDPRLSTYTIDHKNLETVLAGLIEKL